MPEIIVTINPKATGLTVDMNDFHGEGCKAIGEAFRAIGPEIRSEEKPELYENQNQNVIRTGRY